MFRATLAGLRSHARRMVATALAVIFGVAFVAGTLFFRDTATAGFYDTYARSAHGVDAVVDPPARATKQEGVPKLTEQQATVVKGLSGVDKSDVRRVEPLVMLDAKGRPIVNFSQAGYAVSIDGDPGLRAFSVDGRMPTATGEALLDQETAAHQRVAAGDWVTVVDTAGARHRYVVTGLMDFGVSQEFSGSSVVGLAGPDIVSLTGSSGVSEIVVSAKPGVSQQDLVTQITGALGAGPIVKRGDTMRQDLANAATSVADSFTVILLIFGAIALVVAIFVIYNTFAILLAQRIRETALLRCVGATRRQIFGAVVVESVIVGLGGGALGIVGGVGVVYAIFALLNGVGTDKLPVHAPVITAQPVVIGLILGLVVTVVAAFIPAVRATRTSPLAALRDLPTVRITSKVRMTARVAFAAAFAGIGVLLTYRGWHHSDPQTGTFTVVAGGVITFLGVLILSPLFIGPLTALVGLPARSTPGRLAVANARRNPGRTAITTATLMIGVGLMALFSVILASVRTTAYEKIVGHYPVDYVMTGVRYQTEGKQSGIPASYADALRARPEFPTVVVARVVGVRVGDISVRVAAIDPGNSTALNLPKVADGDALYIGSRPWVRGQKIALSPAESVVVNGQSIIGLPGGEQPDVLVSWAQLSRAAGPGELTVVMAKARDGVSATESRDLLDSLSESYPTVQISSMADISNDFESTVNGLIALFAGLIGIAVLISLFGIANTLSLSVVERTRESATLRAIGLTRGQLRGTLVLEAVIMGLVGALVGVTYGLIYGRLVIGKALSAVNPTIVVPWTWIAALFVLAAVASTLAAVLPARRAAKASIVSAMADT
jgi:putative ABC transport system permease protein